MKWHRREKGSYIAESNGERIVIVNRKGDGPSAPAWQGPQPAWEVRIGGRGDYDIGAEALGHHWTLADAKEWAENYASRQLPRRRQLHERNREARRSRKTS